MSASVDDDKLRTFVLVHGAWHGGWCWRRVADVLRRRGHTVFAPSLTGLGDREHLFSKDISLLTHVQDILSVVESEELSDFVLVGHSYGGFVISGVADTLRERVSHYVYLDASVPPDMSPGASFSWAGFNPPETREARLRSVQEQGGGVTLVASVKPPYDLLVPTHRRIWDDETWSFTTLEASHDSMVTAPDALAALLMVV